MSHAGDKTDRIAAVGDELQPRPAWGLALLVGLVAALVFSLWPELDLLVSGLFFRGNRIFLLANTPLGSALRGGFYIVFVLFCALCLLAFGRLLWTRVKTFGFGFRHWLYLLLCVVVGPGLVANALLKEHWGRARPAYVQEFGGTAMFTPPLLPTAQCESNCSFVSGEASSIFMMLFSLAMVLRRQRRRLLVAGAVVGLAAGFVRIGMGGHFLSDVIFAGVTMLLVACLLHWLVFTRFAGYFADGGPLHGQVAALACRLARIGHLAPPGKPR